MLTVRLDEEMEARLNELSCRQMLIKSEIVKNAIQDYLHKQQTQSSAYDLGKDLFGIADGGTASDSASFKQQLKEKLRGKHSH